VRSGEEDEGRHVRSGEEVVSLWSGGEEARADLHVSLTSQTGSRGVKNLTHGHVWAIRVNHQGECGTIPQQQTRYLPGESISLLTTF
jgi:hypothetical protein